MLNKLNVTTPSDLEIVLTRDFNAPRQLVWEAMSKPDLIQRWLQGPPGWEMVLCEDDLRAGGSFRWAWRGADGAEMAMHGIYQEVVPPERIVRTETFDFGCDAQSGEQQVTLTLTDHGDKTSLKLRLLYPSRQARDGAIASGMERGVSASYDRLEEMLASA